MQFFGTKGRVEVEIPFNAPPDRPCRIFVDDGSDLFGDGLEKIEFPVTDQYTVQGDLFSQAARERRRPAFALEDSLLNMRILDALFRSAESGRWEEP
jgi:predicted dehydrogenase